MKIFIINLETSQDRKEKMKTLMAQTNLDYEFFTAIDGRKIENINEIYNPKYMQKAQNRELTKGEIGCAMSHLCIYKKMIDEQIGKALILEDDITLTNDFNIVFDELKNIEMNNDIFLLGQSDANIKTKVYTYKKIFTKSKLKAIFHSGCGAFGYMIDIKAAYKLYTLNFPIKYPCDWWHIFSNFINVYVVEPNIITFIRANSIIDTMGNRKTQDYNTNKNKITVKYLLYIFCRKSYSFCKILTNKIETLILTFVPPKRIK